MCHCTQYSSPTCSHKWLSLTEPCGFGMNLMTCSFRNTCQGLWAPGMCCPWCNGTAMDPFVNQMLRLPPAPSLPAPGCGMAPALPACGLGPPPCPPLCAMGTVGTSCCMEEHCCRRCQRKGKSGYKYRYTEKEGGDSCGVM
jgi:hypothetical protein